MVSVCTAVTVAVLSALLASLATLLSFGAERAALPFDTVRAYAPLPPFAVWRAAEAALIGHEALGRAIRPPEIQLLDLVHAHVDTAALAVAAEVGVADAVHGAPGRRLGLRSLAAACGADTDALGRVVRYLAMRGVFALTPRAAGDEEAEAVVELTAVSMLLLSDHPRSLLPAIRHVWHYGYPAMGQLPEAARAGGGSGVAFARAFGGAGGGDRDTGFFAHLAARPAESALFQGYMTALGSVGDPAIAEDYPWHEAAVVVDVGGGEGRLVHAILRAHASLQAGVVFDEPHVRDAPATAPRDARFQRLAGNMFDDALPSAAPGGSVYLLRQIIHDHGDEACLVLLRNVRAAMLRAGPAAAAAARLVLAEQVVGPLWRAFSKYQLYADIVMLAQLNGRERTPAQYEALLAQAGFRLTRIVETRSPFFLVEAVPTGLDESPPAS